MKNKNSYKTIVKMACAGLMVFSFFPVASHAADWDYYKEVNIGAAHRSFFVPGWGQWRKGYRLKGTAIAALEVIALSGAYMSHKQAQDAEKDYRNGKASYSRHTRKTDKANFFLIAAGVIWGYNVFDAFVGEPAPGVLATLEPDGKLQLAYKIRF